MKKLYTILALAVCAILPMQAQLAPITGSLKSVEKKAMHRAPAATIAAEELVGNYEAFANSAFQGYPDETWAVSITQDEADANKLWIQPVCLFGGLGAADINASYAMYDESNGVLRMPLGQCLYGGPTQQYNMVTGTSVDGETIDTSSTVEFLVTEGENGIVLAYNEENIFGVGDANTDTWWYQAVANLTYTKVLPTPDVYVYEKGVTAPHYFPASQLYFVASDEGVMYLSTADELVGDGIEGTYSAYAQSAFQGYPDESWDVEITVDENDANKVWMTPFCIVSGLAPEDHLPIYAIYDAAAGTLTMPLGQCIYGGPGQEYNLVMGYSPDGATIDTTGEQVYEVVVNSTGVYIQIEGIIGVGNIAAENGWWFQALAVAQFSKEMGTSFPITDIEKITRVAPEAPELTGYFQEGDYLWGGQVTGDGENYQQFAFPTSLEYVLHGYDLGNIFTGITGVEAVRWNINGLAGMFQGVTEEPFPAFSYSVEVEGESYEALSIIDPVDQLPCIGVMSGYDMFLVDVNADGTQLIPGWNFMVIEGTAMYDGTRPCIVVQTSQGISLAAEFSELTLSQDGGVAYGSAVVYDEPVKLENCEIVAPNANFIVKK